MKKTPIIIISFLAFGLFAGLVASNNHKTNDKAEADSNAASLLFSPGTPEVAYYYNYCPSVIQESNGTRHIYYCTNVAAGNVTDYIGYRRGTLQANGSYTYSDQTIVLSPTSGQWDLRHVCDPNVIKGSFSYNSHTYSYLMAYLGCDTSDNFNNEIGLAVSDYPQGPFTKVDSLNPFKHFVPSGSGEWGYGQASMISIDKGSNVLFTYTAGELVGTRVFVEKWNLSNLNSPSQTLATTKVFTNGLTKIDGGIDSVLNNVDFVYDEGSQRIYAIRDNHPSAELNPTVARSAQIIYVEPHPSDTSIGGNLVKFGTWKLLKELDVTATGLNRNHNSCLVRDEYGRVNNPVELEAIVTDGYENYENDWWKALSTYRLYSYKVTVNDSESDYMLDAGTNITYNQTFEKPDTATFRIMPQNSNVSSGNAVCIRIKNNTGTDTPIRISFNCTNDSRNRALSNSDSSKLYYLLSTDGTINSYPYRSWDGDVWLKPYFDGYLVMKKDDQVVDTTYANQGVFSWSSIFATYFTIETFYDYYADYDIGDMYTCNINQSNEISFVKPILQCGLVTNTNSTFILDYLGSGRINIARKNESYIPIVGLIDQISQINPCIDSATSGYNAYSTLLTTYRSLTVNGAMLSYFNNCYIYDFERGDTSHTGLMTNKILVKEKWEFIALQAERNNALSLNTINSDNNGVIVLYVIIGSIAVLGITYLALRKQKHN